MLSVRHANIHLETFLKIKRFNSNRFDLIHVDFFSSNIKNHLKFIFMQIAFEIFGFQNYKHTKSFMFFLLSKRQLFKSIFFPFGCLNTKNCMFFANKRLKTHSKLTQKNCKHMNYNTRWEREELMIKKILKLVVFSLCVCLPLAHFHSSS